MKQGSGLSITLQTAFIVSNGGVPEICRWRPNATAYNSPSIPPSTSSPPPLLDTKNSRRVSALAFEIRNRAKGNN